MDQFECASLRLPLFPHRYKYHGAVFIISGLIFGYLYFFGGKPGFFTTKIFALITSYAETRFLVSAKTNLLDELAGTCIISGLILIGFSKETNESYKLNYLRLKALIFSVYLSGVVWIIFFLLIFGWTIFIFSTVIFLIFLITYIIIFQITRYSSKQKKTLN